MNAYKNIWLGLGLSVVALVHGFETAKPASTPAPAPHVDNAVSAPANPRPIRTFLKIEGEPGPSTVPGYVGWFEVDGFDFGVTAPLYFNDAGEEGDASVLSSVRAFGELGALQPMLLRQVTTGKVVPKVELEQVVLGGKGDPIRLLSVTLINAIPLSIGVDPTRSLEPGTQVATFEFERVRWTTNEINPNGSAGVVRTRGWNVVTGRPM